MKNKEYDALKAKLDLIEEENEVFSRNLYHCKSFL